MSIGRACVVCGKISEQSRCPEHRVPAWHNPRRRRATGSGWAQQARAKRILAASTTCHVCGRPGADQVDHVISLGEGGRDDETNLAPIHSEPCHRDKTAAESARARRNE